uniref:Putative secreted protein n=1 Tax=Ixodes ricinus TaxID=34613 RepID=A0A6B0UN45_IXORI
MIITIVIIIIIIVVMKGQSTGRRPHTLGADFVQCWLPARRLGSNHALGHHNLARTGNQLLDAGIHVHFILRTPVKYVPRLTTIGLIHVGIDTGLRPSFPEILQSGRFVGGLRHVVFGHVL